MPFEDIESDRRKTVLRRMCKLAAVLLIVALATLIVGILAVAISDSKFPFNAGGGIIAGIMASLMSICPMCMLYQAYQFEKYGKSSYDCCCQAVFYWGFFTILGIIFGLAVNGIGALLGCYHRSKETGCWKNKDSQFALAILTVISTSILLILISTIFIICCCNCTLIGYIKSKDYTVHNGTPDDTRAQRDIYRVYNVHQTPGFSVIPGSRFIASSRNSTDMPVGRQITAPTAPAAPPIRWDTTNIGYPGEDANETINSGLTPDEYDPAAFTQRYDDPPPSYYEVMSRDPMETPL